MPRCSHLSLHRARDQVIYQILTIHCLKKFRFLKLMYLKNYRFAPEMNIRNVHNSSKTTRNIYPQRKSGGRGQSTHLPMFCFHSVTVEALPSTHIVGYIRVFNFISYLLLTFSRRYTFTKTTCMHLIIYQIITIVDLSAAQNTLGTLACSVPLVRYYPYLPCFPEPIPRHQHTLL